MKFACAHCGRTYAVADEMQGRSFRMKCRACGNLVVVRGAATAPHQEPALPASELPVAEANPFVVAPVLAAAVGAAVRTERTPHSASRAPAVARAEEPAPKEAAPPAPDAGGDGAAFQDPLAGWDPFEGERQETPSAAATSSPTPTRLPPSTPTAPTTPTPTSTATRTGIAPPTRVSTQPPAPPSLTSAKPWRMASGRSALAVGGAAAALALTGLLALLLAKGKPDAPPTPAAAAAEVVKPVAGATAAPLLFGVEALPPPAPQRERPEGQKRGRGRRAVRVASEERQPAQPSPSPRPLVRPEGEQAQPDVGGAPSSAQIARMVAANRPAFESCIGEAVRRDPNLDTAGRSVVLMLTVNPAGAVADPAVGGADLGETDLGACLKSAAELMVFPAFKGKPVRVEVPLSLGRGE